MPISDSPADSCAAREKHGIAFAGGQGALSGRPIRIGHLGWVSQADIDTALDALAASLPAR